MPVVGMNRQLPAQPGAGGNTDFLQRDCQQARGDLLTGADNHIILPRIMQRRSLTGIFDKLVGNAGHRGDDNGQFMPLFPFRLDPLGHCLDAFDIGNRRATEFLDNSCHLTSNP